MCDSAFDQTNRGLSYPNPLRSLKETLLVERVAAEYPVVQTLY